MKTSISGARRKGGALAPPSERTLVFSIISSVGASAAGLKPRPSDAGADLLIRQGLFSRLLRRTEEGLLNLKDLLTLFPPSCRATFSGLVRRLKRGEAYLLIRRWLLAKFMKGVDEGLLNLKDLPTAFPPRLKGLYENEPVWRCSLGYQIVPNFTIFDQKRAANGLEHGTKRGVFATDLLKRVKSGRSCQAVIGEGSGSL